jgi:sugar phosphate isomerase/epimerase
MIYTRRDLGRIAVAALTAARLRSAAKPNSKFGGVQIGVIAPYSFHGMPGDAESLLKDMVELGINACELQNPPAEAFAGAPTQAGRGGPGGGGAAGRGRGSGTRGGEPGGEPGGGQGRSPGRGGRAPFTPEQQAAQQKAADELKKWRLSASMDKFKELRKMYEDAGVSIYAFKLGLTLAMSDDEYQYSFNVARALGCNHLTMELPTDGALTKRIGVFAAKEKMMVGYHAHTQATPELWDEAMAQSKYNAINLDIGHYTAGTSSDPIPFVKKNHDRITSMHLKDRKYQTNGGQNMPWGLGQTPLKEVLQLMKTEKYGFPGTIELEYTPPEGSDSMKEVARCLQYCKDALA